MSSRTAAVLVLCVLILALAVVAWRAVPWGAGSSGEREQPPASAVFTHEQIQRSETFHAALRPYTLSSLGLSIVAVLLLGLTSLGARIVQWLGALAGGSWIAEAVLGAAGLTVLTTLLTLPLRAGAHRVLHTYGLSTQGWGAWLLDVGKALGIAAVLTAAAFLVFYSVARASPTWWWVFLAPIAALAVCVLSFLHPLLIEPVFNKFTPMVDSTLRTELLELAHRDGVPVEEVFVADASRRTTALNAYVSGYGSTRRIVVYDTLLTEASDEEITSIVAHELGHAKHRDVLTGTLLGAAGAALAVIAGFLLLQWRPLLRLAGVESVTDPRSAGLILAVVAVASLMMLPVQNGISRKIEARADEHALQLTHDPDAFVAVHQRLAVQNIANLQPNPVLYFMFASHPATMIRIGTARSH